MSHAVSGIGTTSYTWDVAAGNLIERTDARGLVTKYEYDALNRLTLVEHWDGETLEDDVDYTYDAVGNRETMTDPTGTTIYVYDDLDRPTSVSFPGPTSVSYQYDNVGNRSRITYPDSKFVDYTYYADNSLETVTDWLDNVATYTYDDAGNLTDTDLPNGVDTDYEYDHAGRLESVVNVGPGPTTISSFDYTLDAVGNRTEMEDLDGTHSYEYDALYRLTEVTYPNSQVDAYTYDAVGNRLTKGTDDYVYDDADQLTDLEGTSFDYDDNGNQTDRGTDWFEYDHENRLTESVIDSVTSTSVYNGDGLRMSHTVSGIGTTNYTWDVAAGLPVVLQDGTNTYVYGLDLITATDGGGVQTYHLYDGLGLPAGRHGSTTGLTDDEGDAVDGYTYDVFGATRSQSGSSDNYWLFTGEQLDADSDMYYLRARYYDPETGRFLGRDPARAGHPYVYGASSPVRYVDPYGLDIFDTVGVVVEGGFDCATHPVACAEEVGGEIVDTVDSFASTPFGAYTLCNPANPFWAIGCTIVVAANPEVIPYVLTAVQILDIAPWSLLGPPGMIAGTLLDFAAFAAMQYQIESNDCLSPEQKDALTGVNIGNLTGGLLGNIPPLAPYISVGEFGAFTGSTLALTCSTAYAGGGSGKE